MPHCPDTRTTAEKWIDRIESSIECPCSNETQLDVLRDIRFLLYQLSSSSSAQTELLEQIVANTTPEESP